MQGRGRFALLWRRSLRNPIHHMFGNLAGDVIEGDRLFGIGFRGIIHFFIAFPGNASFDAIPDLQEYANIGALGFQNAPT